MISHPVLPRHPQFGDREELLQTCPRSSSAEQYLPPPSSLVLTPPARSVFFRHHVCFWGTGQSGTLLLQPLSLPQSRWLQRCRPQLPAAAAPRTRCSPAAEHGQARCMRWHARLKPSVRVNPRCCWQSLSRFLSSSLLPHTMKVRVQRDIWFLAIKTAQFGVCFFFFPSSCPSNPSSLYPAAPRRGGQHSTWMLGPGSPERAPPATASQQSPTICPARMGCCSHRHPAGQDGK